MKKRKLTVIALAAALCAGSFAGCGDQSASSASDSSAVSSAVSEAVSESVEEKAEEIVAAKETSETGLAEIEASKTTEETEKIDASKTSTAASVSGALKTEKTDVIEGADFVLIYNPKIYDEGDVMIPASEEYQSTGDLSDQIVTGINRAGGLDEIEIPPMIGQNMLPDAVGDDAIDRSGERAGGLAEIYDVGDEADFYVFDEYLSSRNLETFECMYAGENCYIWYLEGEKIDASAADVLGEEFDNHIYENDTEAFGPGRFVEEGKLNILCYPMPAGYGGFFYLYDIFSSAEIDDKTAKEGMLNLDKAIININSDFFEDDMDFAASTLAHEYQHQICASDLFYFNLTPRMKTWLNEAMSAYAEELNYPGIKKAGHYNELLYLSENFRNGQSLYNFDTTYDEAIGAYGAVYLFEEYLRENSGDDVFFNIHEYWRYSFDPYATEAQAIAGSVKSDFYDEIADKYEYDKSILSDLDSPEEDWFSKMTLDFHLKTLDLSFCGLEEYGDLVYMLMMYSDIDPVDIEGGGRILVATQDGTYTIPDDADDGLIYIGLDDQMNVVTPMYIKG